MLEALDAATAPLTIGAVADAIGVDQPRASRLVQQAIDLGHVVRQTDPSDARRTLIGLGDGGRELVARVRAERCAAVEAALAGFTPDESCSAGDAAHALRRRVAAPLTPGRRSPDPPGGARPSRAGGARLPPGWRSPPPPG